VAFRTSPVDSVKGEDNLIETIPKQGINAAAQAVPSTFVALRR